MSNKEKIKVGDLCLYHDIPVIVLEIIYQYNSFIQEGRTSFLCLFYSNGTDTLPESALRKL